MISTALSESQQARIRSHTKYPLARYSRSTLFIDLQRSVQFTFRLLVAILNKIFLRCQELEHEDAVRLTCFASSSLFYELACHKGFSAYANIAKQKDEVKDFCVDYMCEKLMENFESYSSALKRLHPATHNLRVYLSDACGPTLISVFHLIAQSLCTENVRASLLLSSLKDQLTLEKIENVLGLPETFLSSVPLPGKEKTKSMWERLKFFQSCSKHAWRTSLIDVFELQVSR